MDREHQKWLVTPTAWLGLTLPVLLAVSYLEIGALRSTALLIMTSYLLVAPAAAIASVLGVMASIQRWGQHRQGWFLVFHLVFGSLSAYLCYVILRFPRINLM